MKKNLSPINSTIRAFKRESNFFTLVEQHLPDSLKAIRAPFRRKNTATTKPTKTAVDLVNQSTSPSSQKCFTKLVCYLSLMSFSTLASAGLDQEFLDFLKDAKARDADSKMILTLEFFDNLTLPLAKSKKSSIVKLVTGQAPLSTQIPKSIYHGAYMNDTTRGYTTEVGEPLLTGMTHTLWRYYVPTRNERVVLNTYGSTTFISPYGELDTKLAVYRIDNSGNAAGFKSLKRVASNDNKRIAGSFSLGSLVQFDAVKGQQYAIQVGSKKVGGDVSLTGFSFPVSGGLSVQPVSINGLPGGYDSTVLSSGPVTYIVHNSTAKALQIKASTTLGNDITLPATFNLAAGAATVKTFALSSTFDKTTPRTLSGEVALSGFAGNVLQARSVMPTVLSKSIYAQLPDENTLQITRKAQVLAGATGSVFYEQVNVKNTGKRPAVGCFARANGPRSQVAWIAYNPITKKVIGTANTPFNLAIGKAQDILVAIRFFHDRLADPASGYPIEIQCANARRINHSGYGDLTDNIDFTNTVTKYPKLTLVNTIPASGILDVTAPGKVFTATFHNESSKTVNVTAEVRAPYEGGTNKRFVVSVCSATTTDAACLKSTASDLPLTVAAGKNITVKVAVRRPSGTVKFDPSYGLSLLLKHAYTQDSETIQSFIPIAGTTKALRKK